MAELNPEQLRTTFGRYATGIVAITTMTPDGPDALVVNSFTSVSLLPALVAFFAAHTSTTWPRMSASQAFCVNILSSAQEALCRQLASRGDNRFAGVHWTESPNGAPLLDGVLAWMACTPVEMRTMGDHDCVLLEVVAHGLTNESAPLVFHASKYRQLVPAG